MYRILAVIGARPRRPLENLRVRRQNAIDIRDAAFAFCADHPEATNRQIADHLNEMRAARGMPLDERRYE